VTVALLFPGQGAQRPGMLELVPATPSAGDVVAEARDVCAELEMTGDLDDPGRDTIATQLSLLTVGVACGRALLDDGLIVSAVAGHSVGAFAAAVTADVLAFRDALVAVHVRAVAMSEACRDRSWGMAAITGATARSVQAMVSDVATDGDPLWIANINGATQTVVGGTVAALAAAEPAARRIGARAFERLDVDIASHGPLQKPTAEALRTHLATVTHRRPVCGYLTNTGGRLVAEAAPIVEDLAQSVAQTVRWYDGVRLMGELGVSCTVEVSPGHTLTRLTAAAVPDMTAISLADEGFSATIRRARQVPAS
jgi:malonate decarboxylase epsilon subunit